MYFVLQRIQLGRALAFEQVDQVRVAVAKDLELHVMGAGDVLLDQQTIVTKRVDGLAARRIQLFGQLISLPDDAHALAPTAC